MEVEGILVRPRDVESPPSRRDGIPAETEAKYRRFACDLVQDAGLALKLPQAVMITAQSIVQRFYYRRSLMEFDAHQVAMGAVFLAAKVEENARVAKDVVNVFVHLKQVRNGAVSEPLDPASTVFDTWKAALCLTEGLLLKELGYDMYGLNCHPHRFVLFFVEILAGPPALAQRAWNYTNDLHRLDVCVRHPPEALACAAILCAAEDCQFGLPQAPAWHALLAPKTPRDELYSIAASIRGLYTGEVAALWLPSLKKEA